MESADSHFTLPGTRRTTQPLLQEVKAQYASEADYQAALKEYRIGEQDLERHLLEGTNALRFTDLRFRPEVQISDQDISARPTINLPRIGVLLIRSRSAFAGR